MHPSHLRVYHGPHEEPVPAQSGQPRTFHKNVTVALGEILPLLCDAVAAERAWLGDFDDDEVTISMDLYEVLLAYQHYRRPSA